MRLILSILFLTLGFTSANLAQTENKPSCPAVAINGPEGLSKPDEIRFYTLKTAEVDASYNIEIIWSVFNGEIVSGQGTKSLGVTASGGGTQTVKVEIKGLPSGCANIFTESISVEPAPEPTKLGQFNWPLGDDYGTFRDIAKAANNQPSSQLYIFTPPNLSTRKEIADKLYKAIPESGTDSGRMTFIDTSGRTALIQIWLVPPGAAAPEKCEECEELKEKRVNAGCPSISVFGPAGIVGPGESGEFLVVIKGFSDPLKLEYRWTVKGARLLSGQGSTKIRMTPNAWLQPVEATVTVFGLPEICANTGSERYQVAAKQLEKGSMH
jgi:hypothetical protein